MHRQPEPAVQLAAELAGPQRIVVLGTVRVRDAVGVRLGWRDGDEAADALVIEMAGDLATAKLFGERIAEVVKDFLA